MELTMKILEFMFQDFTHWLGCFLMISVISNTFTGLISKPIFTIKKKVI
jgi:hypothetical protein